MPVDAKTDNRTLDWTKGDYRKCLKLMQYHVCQTDESCTFQNGDAQSERALLGEGNCGISTE